ncbi:MAG: Rrf2 family transcriptional regulator [Ignavibacteriae bacterium HGW-Ignavibacteriae-2]|jgi:Rrf2 family protein|nr:Rrf2 family transcriptional regulator [Bacteroidota bacterium]PKL88866.1 MAG: Rrf2 family transcriptional regulator [Ignavibacteriae bacterium HGW-Ignavibacteriae-2]
MTVIFSKKCEVGLQAVLFLSTRERDTLFNAQEVSENVNQPKEFVSKMLQVLTASGIVGSRKGKNGGFYLAKLPKEIKLIDIVEAIDGLGVFNNCVLGFPGCSSTMPCPVHDKWGKLRDDAYKMLSEETLCDLKDKSINKIETLKSYLNK